MRASAFFLFAAIATFMALPETPLRAAPVPKHLMKEPVGDLAKLQGKWKLQSIRFGATLIPTPQGLEEEFTLEFRGDKVYATIEKHKRSGTAKISVVEGVNRLEIKDTNATDKTGQPSKQGDFTVGYVLEGDTLRVASALDANKAPADPTKPGDKVMIIVLTRVKGKNTPNNLTPPKQP